MLSRSRSSRPVPHLSFEERISLMSDHEVIVDDLGINALTADRRSDLLEAIECRSGRKSTLVTSQLPVKRWHDYLADSNPTVAEAIMDRIVSGAHRIELVGESMRPKRKPRADKK